MFKPFKPASSGSRLFVENRFENVRGPVETIVGPGNVFTSETDLLLYSYDSGLDRARPEAVVRFTATSQVAGVVRILYEAGIPYVARCSGTNLSGGCIPLRGGVILNLASLNKILRIDTAKNFAVVEPGVINMALQQELGKAGYFYPPDPASQKVCSIGGNVGENAGGPSCLKHGVTSNHVIALDVVTPEGGTAHWSVNDPGPDMVGLFVGSEGTLGIATGIWLNIVKNPACVKTALAAFPSLETAISAVTGIIASGVVPRAIEAMDRITVEAVEGHTKAGYPRDAEAVLIIEFDGAQTAVETESKIAETMCRKNSCSLWRIASEECERNLLWEGRRGSYAAMSRLAPNILVEDGVVPRPKLPEALALIREITAKHGVRAGLVFHAGDGNLHPNMVFDERNRKETYRVKKAGYEILKACVDLGGSISGEHGVGVNKRVAMHWLFDETALDLFRGIKLSLDHKTLANPDKITPVSSEKISRRPSLFGRLSPEAVEIAEQVRARYARRQPSVIVGWGTRLPKHFRGHDVPELSLKKLRRIIDLDPANFTVTFEAGIDTAHLKKAVAREGCHLLLPETAESVGGLMASRAYPGIRNMALGAQLLLPDGRIAEFGGKVMKNAAGYDLSKFLVGSWGAFGIILALTLRLYPKPFEGGDITSAPAPFVPDETRRSLKKVFDPENLFNPFIFGQQKNFTTERTETRKEDTENV